MCHLFVKLFIHSFFIVYLFMITKWNATFYSCCRPTGRPTEDQKKEYDQWISKMKFAYENIKKKMQTREKAFREKQLAKQKAKAQAKAEN